MPQKRSGGYAVLLTLFRQSQVHLTLSHLVEICTGISLWSNQNNIVLLSSASADPRK